MAQNEEKKGVLPQIIVAVVVTLLVGGTSPWWWRELFQRDKNYPKSVSTQGTTTQSPTESPNKSNSANASGPSDTPKTQVQGGKIQVRCAANPTSIPAGGQVEINVLALTEQGSPLSGANVRIDSGGGWFSASGTTTEVGQTGSNGRFTTRWKSPNPAVREYGMGVTVAKNSFTEGKGEFSVFIQ